MYRPPDIETLTDFHQYYRGAYIGWQENGTYRPAAVVRVGEDGRDSVILSVEGETRVVSFRNIMEQCQFGAPQYGSAEVGPTCVYVARRAPRQASRGHRTQGLHTHIFHPDLMEMSVGSTLTSWPYLKALFNPRYRNFVEAFEELTQGNRMACSVGRHFTLSLEEGVKYPVLFHKTELIGHALNAYEIELEKPDQTRLLVCDNFPEQRVR